MLINQSLFTTISQRFVKISTHNIVKFCNQIKLKMFFLELQIPTGLSMGVSFISAITVIGAPVEAYLFGAVLAWMVIGYMIGLILTAMYFVPFVYRLNISSIYEVCIVTI